MKRLGWVALVFIVLLGGAAWRLRQPYQGFEEGYLSTSRGAQARSPWGSGWRPRGWCAARGISWLRGCGRALGCCRPASTVSIAPPPPVRSSERLARGDVFYYSLTVPEGWNMFDIAQAAGRFGVFSAAQFLRAARDPSSIRDLDPQAPSLEGYLFPETYRLTRHATPRDLCRQMTARFREAWNRAGGGRRSSNRDHGLAGGARRQAAGGASVDRRRFLQPAADGDDARLRLHHDLRRAARRAVARRHPPLRPGQRQSVQYLPPRGPSARPHRQSRVGIDWRRASSGPSQALYFVARPDGSGGHQFSLRLADHQAAVERYRRGARK